MSNVHNCQSFCRRLNTIMSGVQRVVRLLYNVLFLFQCSFRLGLFPEMSLGFMKIEATTTTYVHT